MHGLIEIPQHFSKMNLVNKEKSEYEPLGQSLVLMMPPIWSNSITQCLYIYKNLETSVCKIFISVVFLNISTYIDNELLSAEIS